MLLYPPLLTSFPFIGTLGLPVLYLVSLCEVCDCVRVERGVGLAECRAHRALVRALLS